ncbi:MAG: M23 family metallopeptidase [Fidelibacterota bacterium]
MRFTSLLKGIFLIVPVLGIAGDYLWPTEATRLLSGTFGETRSGHFHSGIDIKTWGRNGYACFAPEDGYIERVLVSPTGYGKALYIRLKDNRVAVLAHLDSFHGRIASRVQSEQLSSKKVFLELVLNPGEYPVRKGDIVAYSGNSGTVVPHVHFEIRDSSNYPINPLLNGFPIEDDVAPEPVEIAFIPLSPGARVNGSPDGMIFPLVLDKGNTYTLNDTVYLHGTFGISLKTWDRGNYPHNKNGVYSINLYLDGKDLFESRFDRLNWDQTHWMHEDRNYRLSYEGNGNFYRLFTFESTEDLSFYRSENGGYLTVEEGIHTCVIQVRDANGNRSGVKITLKGVETPDNPCQVNKQDDIYTISVDSCYLEKYPNAELLIERYNPYGHKEAQVNRTLGTLVKGKLKIKAEEKNCALLLRVIPKHGPVPPPLLKHFYDPENYPKGAIQVVPRHFSAGILFEIKSNMVLPPSLLLSLEGRACKPLDWEAVTAGYARTALIPPDEFESYHKLNIYDYHLSEWETVWNISPHVVKTTERISFRSEDEQFGVVIPEKTFFRDVISWISTEEKEKDPEGGEIISKIYSLHPMDQPLNGALEIALRSDPTYPWHAQTGLYRAKGDGKWSLVSQDPEPEKDYYQTRTRSCGTYALMRDLEPPVFEKVFPGNGGQYYLKDLNKAWVEVSDNLSGIDAGNLVVTLNGTWMIYYYNAPTRIVSVEMPRQLPAGEHTLEWILRDNAGHERKKIVKFYIIE